MKEEGQRGCRGEQREDNEERGLSKKQSGQKELNQAEMILQTCVIVAFWHHVNSRISFVSEKEAGP